MKSILIIQVLLYGGWGVYIHGFIYPPHFHNPIHHINSLQSIVRIRAFISTVTENIFEELMSEDNIVVQNIAQNGMVIQHPNMELLYLGLFFTTFLSKELYVKKGNKLDTNDNYVATKREIRIFIFIFFWVFIRNIDRAI